MTLILTGIAITALTLAGVELFRRWSLRRNLLDLPNERSSHTLPTPRGGGLIVALVCLTAFAAESLIDKHGFNWSYPAGASLIAAVSWLDDVYGISFIWRFAVHSAAALILIFGSGFFAADCFPYAPFIGGGLLGAAVTFGWIVWLTNAYNFMDGIDGIAGSQAVTAGLGWLFIGLTVGAPETGIYAGVIAASACGFLLLNWQPSKIFMGDVGSAFLGYTFAAMPLLADRHRELAVEYQSKLLPATIILLWLFIFDTLWTFAGRIWRREKIWQAHRGHLYQKLVAAGYQHQTVTLVFAVTSMSNIAAVRFLMHGGGGGWIICWLILQSAGLLGWNQFSIRRKQIK